MRVCICDRSLRIFLPDHDKDGGEIALHILGGIVADVVIKILIATRKSRTVLLAKRLKTETAGVGFHFFRSCACLAAARRKA